MRSAGVALPGPPLPPFCGTSAPRSPVNAGRKSAAAGAGSLAPVAALPAAARGRTIIVKQRRVLRIGVVLSQNGARQRSVRRMPRLAEPSQTTCNPRVPSGHEGTSLPRQAARQRCLDYSRNRGSDLQTKHFKKRDKVGVGLRRPSGGGEPALPRNASRAPLARALHRCSVAPTPTDLHCTAMLWNAMHAKLCNAATKGPP
jgi:hypothetical protein